MTRTGNPDGLRSAAEQKKNDALERTDKAISQLVKEGKKINFHTVAKTAGVSVAYLYKHDSIKQRIDQLRKQQSPIKGLAQPSTSDDSKKAIITALKKRISDLQAENRGLRDHLEVVQGIAMQVTEYFQQIEALNVENSKLKEQLDECRHQSESQLSSILSSDAKVTSIGLKRTERLDISEKIKQQLARLGIPLNSTLTKTIQSASVEIVLGAIEALTEAMDHGDIQRPGGWLNSAIKDGWIPNEKHLPQHKAERDIFKEWFNLAFQQKLVMASTKGDDGQMYVYNLNGVPLPFEQMLAEYPLEKLKLSL
ncbi:DUF6262 family protein [Iningainema tapete]|uniref:Transposase n=1 Tax=Iningainema tapete BLCC-T55 TaxID=2748662 RepID=A0A8J6XPI1_9CYAN|nr:DUF6262 family protein [Iningainema tapete]MBD2777072.1 hypothetical protein [Iningainema tapete BLCC-T55]